MNRDGTFHEGAILAGRYLIEAMIGEGAFARTYRGRDTRLDRVVAIKILRPHIAADPPFLNRFQQEARASARIDHTNVVHVYDSGEDGGTAFLVMQYVPGRDLKQFIIEQAPLPVADAIRITREILNGLAAVHRAGIIHRDIKPQNVLLGWDGVARVTDFGIAYEGNQNRQPFATEQGTTLGTPAYMAPEQARGEAVTAATDIYAVGIVLFELLTGNLPFTAENQLAMMVAHVEQPPPAPGSFRHGIPADLDAITLRAMAKIPGQRFAGATEMERALGNALRALSSGASDRPTTAIPANRAAHHAATTVVTPNRTPAPPPVPVQPRRGGAGRWVLPFIFLALAGIVLAGTLTGAIDGLRGNGNGNETTTPRPTRTPSGNSGGLQPITRTPTDDPTESATDEIIEREPTEAVTEEVNEPEPTDTPEPTPDEGDSGGVPTIAPSDPDGEVTVDPGEGGEPLSQSFSATDWEGGVTRGDSGFLGRPWTAIYGEASGSNQATLSFSLDSAPTGDISLIVTGLDDESGGDSPISITVNGEEIFSGTSPFEDWDGVSDTAPWTDGSFSIPAGLLQEGSNQITVANLSSGGEEGLPPYVLLSDALLTE